MSCIWRSSIVTRAFLSDRESGQSQAVLVGGNGRSSGGTVLLISLAVSALCSYEFDGCGNTLALMQLLFASTEEALASTWSVCARAGADRRRGLTITWVTLPLREGFL